MKNKKILNICLLTFALISLITFILPIKKFEFLLSSSTAVNVVFYICNTILVISLTAIIVFAIINLFKDNYNFVLLMEALSLVSFIMVFIVVMLFACLYDFKIGLGYILVSIEVFFLANFSQMARLFYKKQDLMVSTEKLMGNKKNKSVKLNKGYDEPEVKIAQEVDNKTSSEENSNLQQNNENKNA